ncbi:MAG: proline--tRNA ligase, partial [Bdellovibrionales bacterium]|nr:proline--tRNA ligase [Bdellovibrionales bacterium]
AGLYHYLPMGLRILKKIERIVREEMDASGALEFELPILTPAEIWQESGRWNKMGREMFRQKDRHDMDYCLGPTHEEAFTTLLKPILKSYKDLPKNVYQIHTKFRDEIRPRFGVIRCREFLMKDAYSFDLDQANAKKSYRLMREAYAAIFQRLGLDFRIVKADSGNIGGDLSEEFHLLAEHGEDLLLVAEDGDFAANVEVCPAVDAEERTPSSSLLPVEEFETKGLKKISTLSQALKIPEDELVKTLFYSAAEEGEKELKAVAVLLRGNDELNLTKFKKALKINREPRPLEEQEVKDVSGAWPGSCGPVGLKIPVYVDNGVTTLSNFIVGANKDGFHLKNVNRERDFVPTFTGDLRQAHTGDKNPEGDGLLKEMRGIEVGHIFYLGTKYSKSMNAKYLDESGKEEVIEMGCYGIGVTRTVQASIESSHDKDGIIWPLSIAPFAVHICLLDPDDEATAQMAQKIYEGIWEAGYDCFLDDRPERPGPKFKDADLLGMPLRLNIGARGIKNNEIELVERRSKNIQKVSVDQALGATIQWLQSQ